MAKKKSYRGSSSYKPGFLSQKKKKNLQILLFSLAGIAFVLGLLYLFLVELAPNIDLFWRMLRPGAYETPQRRDRIPPTPPYLKTLPDATNKETFDISGFAEPGAKAVLYLNDSKTSEVVVDNEGSFSFESINLFEGENKIRVKAVDDAGNESNKFAEHTVVLDKEEPNLAVDEPNDGQSFEGEENETIEVKGKTEAEAKVTVSGHWVRVNEDGNFTHTLRLEDGENKIEVVAKDEAGNETQVELTVTYDAPDED